MVAWAITSLAVGSATAEAANHSTMSPSTCLSGCMQHQQASKQRHKQTAAAAAAPQQLAVPDSGVAALQSLFGYDARKLEGQLPIPWQLLKALPTFLNITPSQHVRHHLHRGCVLLCLLPTAPNPPSEPALPWTGGCEHQGRWGASPQRGSLQYNSHWHSQQPWQPSKDVHRAPGRLIVPGGQPTPMGQRPASTPKLRATPLPSK